MPRWSWMDKEDGWWVAGRVTKSSGGYFYAKLLVRRVNICMASRERVHLFPLFTEDARIFLLFSEKPGSQGWKFRSNIWRFQIIIFLPVNYPQIKTSCFTSNSSTMIIIRIKEKISTIVLLSYVYNSYLLLYFMYFLYIRFYILHIQLVFILPSKLKKKKKLIEN